MSYYSQTKVNPVSEDGTTNANPTDNTTEVPFPVSYNSIDTIRVNLPHNEVSQDIELVDLQERELDPEVDKTLTDNNFRALSGL